MRNIHLWRKYGVATTVYFTPLDAGTTNFAVGADWTPVAGDVKIDKDEAGPGNVGTLPSAVASGNGAYWKLPLSVAELTAALIVITVIDAAAKAIEDVVITIETYGNASAQHAVDLDDSVRAGLTALPAVAAGAEGGVALVGEAYSGTAAAGATATITLDAGASASDDFYKDRVIMLIKGTGKGQVRRIISYVGATKVATVDVSWATVPDTSSQFLIT